MVILLTNFRMQSPCPQRKGYTVASSTTTFGRHCPMVSRIFGCNRPVRSLKDTRFLDPNQVPDAFARWSFYSRIFGCNGCFIRNIFRMPLPMAILLTNCWMQPSHAIALSSVSRARACFIRNNSWMPLPDGHPTHKFSDVIALPDMHGQEEDSSSGSTKLMPGFLFGKETGHGFLQ